MTFGIIFINYLILPKSMSMIQYDSESERISNYAVRRELVKSCSSEIEEQNQDASFTDSQNQSHALLY